MPSRRDSTERHSPGSPRRFSPGWVSRIAAMQVRGVRVGLITGSLNPLGELGGRDPIDVIVEQCKQLDVLDVELVTVFPQGQPEVVNGGRFGQPPAQITPDYMKTRQALRAWRIALPLDRFKEVRRKFDAAKLNLFSYIYTIDDHMTDAEIEAAFRQLQALGVPMFTTNQTRVGMGLQESHRCPRIQHQGRLAPSCRNSGSQ